MAILRLEPRGEIKHYGPEYSGGPSIGWVVTYGTAAFAYDAGTLSEEDLELAESTPLRLGRGDKGREYWLYESKIYSTYDFELTPEDVSALVNEVKNKRRLRLAKAHALAAMAAELDTVKKRSAIPQDVRVAVWQRDGGRCVECSSQEKLEFDHIIPFSMGGANTVRNLQLLCEVCNRRKGATLG